MPELRFVTKGNRVELTEGERVLGCARFLPLALCLHGGTFLPMLNLSIGVVEGGRRLGTRLMKKLLNMREVNRSGLLELSTTTRNIGHRLYRNMGFVDVYACPWAVKLVDFDKAFRHNVELNIENACRSGVFESPAYRRYRYSARFLVDDYPSVYVRGSGGRVSYTKGDVALTVQTDATTMIRLWNGASDAYEAVREGNIRLKGRLQSFVKLASIIFPGILTGAGLWTSR